MKVEKSSDKKLFLRIVEGLDNPPSERWLNELVRRGEKFFVFEDKGFIAVSPFFKYDKHGLELDVICVSKQHQRKGIGRELLKKAESVAKSLKRRFIYLFVSEQNSGALTFYKKSGFTVCGRLNDRYGPGKHSFILRKKV